MQPDRNQNDWQQPAQQSPQSPYATSSGPTQQPTVPVPLVTLTSDADASAPVPAPTQPQQPVTAASPTSMVPAEQAVPAAEVTSLQEPVADERAAEASPQPSQEPVRWQAHEYIHHEKNILWFIVFSIVVAALIAAAIFIIHSWTFAILVPVMAAALLVYAHRPPRVLDYTLSRQGIHINDHLYPFVEFKGFGIVRDGEEYSVMLLPTKRFKPGVTIYFPEEAGEAIVDMLGARLPMQELHLDIVDRIIRKLRI